MGTIQTTVNEGTSLFVTATFVDQDGASVVPDSVTVRIDDNRSGTEIRAATSVTPASEIEIEVTPTENAIIGTSYAVDYRTITVTAVYDTTRAVADIYEFQVKNLRFKT